MARFNEVILNPNTRRKMMIKRILGMPIALAALAGVAAAALSLTGAGATFPYPMYSKWFSDYHKMHADTEINYQSIGSGGGIKQVTEGTVDFGATDGPMNDTQVAEFKTKRKCDVLHFPTGFLLIDSFTAVSTEIKANQPFHAVLAN